MHPAVRFSGRPLSVFPIPGERTRPGCWHRRPADVSGVPGGTPGTACETQALPGKFGTRVHLLRGRQPGPHLKPTRSATDLRWVDRGALAPGSLPCRQLHGPQPSSRDRTQLRASGSRGGGGRRGRWAAPPRGPRSGRCPHCRRAAARDPRAPRPTSSGGRSPTRA